MLVMGLPNGVHCLLLGTPVEWKLHEGQTPLCLSTPAAPAQCLPARVFVSDRVEGAGLQQGAGGRSFCSIASFSFRSFPSAPTSINYGENLHHYLCSPARVGFRTEMISCKRKEHHPIWKEMPNREHSPSGCPSSL